MFDDVGGGSGGRVSVSVMERWALSSGVLSGWERNARWVAGADQVVSKTTLVIIIVAAVVE